MRIFVFIIVICYASKTLSKFSVKKVEGIEGKIKKIRCTSNPFDYYCFIWSNTDTESSFYKIDSERKVVFMEEFGEVIAMHVNSKNEDVYLFEKTPYKKISEYRIWMKKNDWEDFKTLHDYTMANNKSFKSLMDDDNYLYFTTEQGPMFLRGKQNVPIAFYADLKKYDLESFETDSKGNVYFRIKVPGHTLDWVFQLTRKAKNADLPPFERINYCDTPNSVLTSIGMGSSRGVYFATSNGNPELPIGQITKWVGRKLEILHAQHNSNFNYFCTTADRLYFTNVDSYIYFFDNDDEVSAITPLKKRPSLQINKCQEDFRGNVYFPYKKSILKIEKGERKVTKIATPSSKKISSIFIDHNDDLWAIGKDLYYFKNDDLKAITVPNITIDKESIMEENTKNSEILIGNKDGLFIVYEEKSDA